VAFDLLAGSLEELWLYSNELISIPKLNKLKRLKSLSLSMNMIKEFPDNILIGLKELKQLRLKGNQICNL
jgi:Leucine-rich repeat (LRR) protein